MNPKKLLAVFLSLIMVLGLLPVSALAEWLPEFPTAEGTRFVETYAQATTQGGAILHCFDWSYDAIKEALPDIAAAGYTAVQTSPVQQPKDYSASYTDGSGQWWKLYQPLGFRVAPDGTSWLGTKDDLTELCEEASEYDIKVIVDIVANHLANNGQDGGTYDYLNDNVDLELKYPAYFHTNNDYANDDSRYNITQYHIGMPDLNTGDPFVQESVLDLLKECIDCGVDGFRFDAAKHIETPTDDSSFASSFWTTVVNGAEYYYRHYSPDWQNFFCYGEILGAAGPNFGIDNYTEYIAVTDNYTGDRALDKAYYQWAPDLVDSTYYKGAAAADSVLWVESHDTYMGNSGTAGFSNTSEISDDVIVRAWAIVGSRAESTSLFFARPNSVMGQASADTTWKSKAVAEVNKFKTFFEGTAEYLSYSGTNIAVNERSRNGAVVSKLDGGGEIDIPVYRMKDGTYVDQVTGNTFTVTNSRLVGTVGPTGVAVVYNRDSDAVDYMPNIRLYLKPASNWLNDGARFAMYLFNLNTGANAWVSMTPCEDGRYYADVPQEIGFTNVIFCRMDPDSTENSWSNKWNQTTDLCTDRNNNCYSVAEGTWDNGGGSWSFYDDPSAIVHLQELVDAAAAGSTLVLSRDYFMDFLEDPLSIGKKITIDLNGHTIYGLDYRPTTYMLIVGQSGDLTVCDSSSGNTGAIVSRSGCFEVYGSVTLDGITARNEGRGNSNGGCVYAGSGSSVTLNDCTLNGISNTFGGAIYMAGGSSVRVNGGVLRGQAPGDGGCVYCRDATFVMNGGIIENSHSNSPGGAFCTYSSNSYSTSCTVTLNGTTIRNCSSNAPGGVFNLSGGSVTINDSTIENCASEGSNAGFLNLNSGKFKMTGSTVSGCTANSSGGMAFIMGGEAEFIDTQISDCHAENEGGAIYTCGGTMTLDSCVITGCSSHYEGGGVYAVSTTKLKGSVIVSGNTGSGGVPDNVYLTPSALAIDEEEGLSSSARIGINRNGSGIFGIPVTSGLKGKGDISNFFSDSDDTVLAVQQNGELYFGTKVTLSLEPGEGSGTMDDIVVPYGFYIYSDYIPVSFTPPEGTMLLGWDGVYEDVFPGSNNSFTRDDTLTAVWTAANTLTLQGAGADAQAVKWEYHSDAMNLTVRYEGYGVASFPTGSTLSFPGLREGYECNIELVKEGRDFGAVNVTQDVVLTMPEAYPVSFEAINAEYNARVTFNETQQSFVQGMFLQPGDEVQFDFTPDANCESDSVAVTYYDGNETHEVELTCESVGRYSFTMPAYPVTVSIVCSLTPWGELQALVDAGGTIVLDRDYTMGENNEELTVGGSVSGGTVTIDLNGHTIAGMNEIAGVICVNNDASLVIKDLAGGGGIVGGYHRTIRNYGALTLEGVALTGGDSSGYGIFSEGTTTINGGSIKNFVTLSSGAGIYVTGGVTTLNGVEISGCVTENLGGGAFVNRGLLILNDCTVTGNSARISGGIYAEYGSVMINGGTISGNTAESYAGGVYFTSQGYNSAVIMGSAVIADNHCGEENSNMTLGYGSWFETPIALGEDALIGVNLAFPPYDLVQTVVTLADAADAEKFFSDVPDRQALSLDGLDLVVTCNAELQFDANGGSGSTPSQYAMPGTEITLPECGFTAPVHKYFTGWEIDGTVCQPGDPYTLDANTTAYAVWADMIEVSFSANGGTGETASVWAIPNSSVTLPECGFTPPVHKGFSQWKLGSEYYSPGDELHVGTSSVTLTACWLQLTEVVFSLEFDDQGDSYSVWVMPNSMYVLPECGLQVPEHAYFICWELEGDEYGEYYPGDEIFVGTETVYVFADWAYMPRVSFFTFDGSGSMDPVWVELNTFYVLPECGFTAPAEMMFVGWNYNGLTMQPGEFIHIDGSVELVAVWAGSVMEITFAPGSYGSGSMEPRYAEYGTIFILPECGFTPEEGMEFCGWMTVDSPDIYYPGNTVRIDGDIEFIATWSVSVRTVSFLANGGSGSMGSISVVLGSYLTVPACGFTASEHQYFTGWTVEGGDGTVYLPNDDYLVVSDVTFVAQWADLVSVTFNANGGTGSMSTAWLVPGDDYCLPYCGFAAPENMRFIGWRVGNDETLLYNGEWIHVDSNVTVTAVWEQIIRTVSFYKNGGSGSMESELVAQGSVYTIPECGFNPPVHKHFACWSSDGTLYQPGDEITVTADLSLSAVWEDTVFTITFLPGEGTGTMDPVVKLEDSNYYLPSCGFTAPEHKRFAGWSPDNQTNVVYPVGKLISVTCDMTFTALWEDNILTVRFSSSTGEITDPVEYLHGTVITLPECSFSAPIGKYFAGWSFSGELYQPGDQFTVTENTVLAASWEDACRVHFFSSGGSGYMPDVWVDPGSEYVLPECGYTSGNYLCFTGWKVDGTDYQPGDIIIVTENITVIAQWSVGVSIHFDPTDGSGSMSDLWVLEGTVYTLPECGFTPPAHSYFRGWTDVNGSSNPKYQPGDTLTIETGTIFYAVWGSKALIYFSKGSESCTGSMNNVWVMPGTSYTVPECGFTPNSNRVYFGGWKYNNTIYQPGDVLTITGDTTFVAQWPEKLHVSFNKNDGEGADMNWIYVMPGEEVELPVCTYTREGYVCMGWIIPTLENKVRAFGTKITVTQNISAKAYWNYSSVAAFKKLIDDAPTDVEYVIKLYNDVVSSQTNERMVFQIITDRNIVVDLNGHAIDRALTSDTTSGQIYAYVFNVNGGTLTLRDSAGGGIVTGGYAGTNTSSGSIVNIESGTFILESGKIKNDFVNNGAVLIRNGSFVMTGGTLEGSYPGVNDNGVDLISGSMLMSGGSITGFNTGVTINYLSAVSVTVTGGSITACQCSARVPDNCTFSIEGDPVIRGTYSGGVQLYSGAVITVSGPLDPSALIMVTSNPTPTLSSPVVITDGLPGNGTIANFMSGSSNNVIGQNADGEIILAKKATVSFDANGGAGEMANVTTPSGGVYVLPECGFTAPENHYFAGWSVGETTYQSGESCIITGNTTVTAVWGHLAEIVFDANGGEGSMDSAWLIPGVTLTLPECGFTAPEGKNFGCWLIDGEEYAPGDEIEIAGFTLITAGWYDLFNISFVNWDGTLLYSCWAEPGETPVYVGNTPKRHTNDRFWYFEGWSPDIVPATADATYTALFKASQTLVNEYGNNAVCACWVLDGTETALRGGYYTILDDVAFTHGLTSETTDEITFIIPDGLTLSIGSADAPVEGVGMSFAGNVKFFGQTEGTGVLSIHAGTTGIYSEGSVLFGGGEVNIVSAAESDGFGVYGTNVSAKRGSLRAEGACGVFSLGGLSLGWATARDSIYASSYSFESIQILAPFTNNEILIDDAEDVTEGSVIDGKLLRPLHSAIHELSHVEAVPPTATEYGNIEYWYCGECGLFFADELGVVEISQDSLVLEPIGTPGDVDGNGSITTFDALIILRLALGLLNEPTPEQLAAADFDGNGVVNSFDALLVLRKALGLI